MGFSDAQLKAIQIRNKNVVVSASAGSGKTSVLVERLTRLVIEDRISIDSILSMTFTNAAAAEMKGRLKKALQEKRKETPEDPYIQNQLSLLETASICTIDSFCQSVVKQFYYEIPISYTMAQNVGNEADILKAFQTAYDSAIQQLDTIQYTNLRLFFKAYGYFDENIKKLIKTIIDVGNSKADINAWFDSIVQSYHQIPEEYLKWFYQFFIEKLEAMNNILEYMLVQIQDMPFKKEADYTKYYNIFTEKKKYNLDCISLLKEGEYSSFRNRFISSIDNTPALPGTILKVKFKQCEDYKKKYQEDILDVLFDIDVFTKDLENNKENIQTLIQLCKLTREAFAKEKKKLECIDFTDMEHFTLQLLNNPHIQEELRNKYEMILVDEFQDTNELQEAIISKFCRDNNVFRVGDIKQSIYGFRQAKPSIMRSHMMSTNENDCALVLEQNYRSNKSIVDFNNDFYEKIMNTELLGTQFFKEDIAKIGLDRQVNNKQYPIRFLYSCVDEFSELNDISKLKAKPLLKYNRYEMIAKDILKQVKDGRKFKDFCILLRNRTNQEELKACLEANHIPVFAQITSGFFTNNAVQIVCATLSSLTNPYDDIQLMATLCSPLFNVTTEQIAQACATKTRKDSLYKILHDYSFMESFNELKAMRHNTIYDLVRTIYQFNDFYYNHTSSQDKTNLDYLLEKASAYPYPYDIPGFIQQLEEESKIDKTGEASAVGKEDNVVRIMTMHASKGLQFPVVYILSNHSNASRYLSAPALVDSDLGVALASLNTEHRTKRISLYQIAAKTKIAHQELMEEMRILYVATTRAEEELIFVDFIDSESEFDLPLNTYALLNQTSYTGWMFHVYRNSGKIQFEKHNSIYEPMDLIKNTSSLIEKKMYSKECTSLSSVTASSKKQKHSWKPFFTSIKNVERGTLFHEAVAKLSYPYKEEDVMSFLENYDYKCSKKDILQILSLNNCKEYQDYMNHKHEFELSYIVKEENSIIHGFMDLVVWLDDRIVILDFKTDTVNNEDELIKMYKVQLETYKKSMESIVSNIPIETVIYSFHLKNLIFLK